MAIAVWEFWVGDSTAGTRLRPNMSVVSPSWPVNRRNGDCPLSTEVLNIGGTSFGARSMT